MGGSIVVWGIAENGGGCLPFDSAALRADGRNRHPVGDLWLFTGQDGIHTALEAMGLAIPLGGDGVVAPGQPLYKTTPPGSRDLGSFWVARARPIIRPVSPSRQLDRVPAGPGPRC